MKNKGIILIKVPREYHNDYLKAVKDGEVSFDEASFITIVNPADVEDIEFDIIWR